MQHSMTSTLQICFLRLCNCHVKHSEIGLVVRSEFNSLNTGKLPGCILFEWPRYKANKFCTLASEEAVVAAALLCTKNLLVDSKTED